MKKALFIVVALLAATALYRYTRDSDAAGDVPPIASRGFDNDRSATPSPAPTVMVDGHTYAYDVFRVGDVTHLSLIPNFVERETVSSIIESHACTAAANAGFYDTDHEPLGLFIADGQMRSDAITSALLNGYLWITDTGSFGLTAELPDLPMRVAVQNGPFVIFSGTTMTLRIREDEPARRTIVAISRDNALVFITLYDPTSVFLGPTLTATPGVVEAVAEAEGTSYDAALNLDGGSASAFYTPTRRLSELSTVGAVFCLNE